jgi:hypothetical protein
VGLIHATERQALLSVTLAGGDPPLTTNGGGARERNPAGVAKSDDLSSGGRDADGGVSCGEV